MNQRQQSEAKPEEVSAWLFGITKIAGGYPSRHRTGATGYPQHLTHSLWDKLAGQLCLAVHSKVFFMLCRLLDTATCPKIPSDQTQDLGDKSVPVRLLSHRDRLYEQTHCF